MARKEPQIKFLLISPKLPSQCRKNEEQQLITNFQESRLPKAEIRNKTSFTCKMASANSISYGINDTRKVPVHLVINQEMVAKKLSQRCLTDHWKSKQKFSSLAL